MFEVFFQSLLNLGNETMLLESCDWDEEKLAALKEKFSETVENIFNSSVSNKNDAIDKIKLEMSSYASIEQIDILIEILESSVEKSLNSGVEAEYEN
jgi:sortase (surface protein transpeptidase)